MPAVTRALNEKIYFNRGNTFFQMGKYQEAIESYKKALELGSRRQGSQTQPGTRAQEAARESAGAAEGFEEKGPAAKQDKQDQKQQGASDQQKQQQPSQPKDQQNQPQNANSKPEQDQKRPQPGQQQKPGMDPKEALRILDALNQQEKQEQRKQALKIQRERAGGKDW